MSQQSATFRKVGEVCGSFSVLSALLLMLQSPSLAQSQPSEDFPEFIVRIVGGLNLGASREQIEKSVGTGVVISFREGESEGIVQILTANHLFDGICASRCILEDSNIPTGTSLSGVARTVPVLSSRSAYDDELDIAIAEFEITSGEFDYSVAELTYLPPSPSDEIIIHGFRARNRGEATSRVSKVVENEVYESYSCNESAQPFQTIYSYVGPDTDTGRAFGGGFSGGGIVDLNGQVIGIHTSSVFLNEPQCKRVGFGVSTIEMANSSAAEFRAAFSEIRMSDTTSDMPDEPLGNIQSEGNQPNSRPTVHQRRIDRITDPGFGSDVPGNP